MMFRRWKYYFIFVGINICVLYFLFFPRQQISQQIPSIFNSSDFLGNKFSETLILEITCKLPIIEPDEANLKGYVQHYRSIHCNSKMPNMASMDGEYLIVHGEMELWKKAQIPNFKCYYRGLSGGLYPNITWYQLVDKPVQIIPNERLSIPYDQFVVQCYNKTLIGKINDESLYNDSIFYERTFVTFSKLDRSIMEAKRDRSKFAKADPEKPSISILVLDSISTNQFLRHMHKTVNYMRRLGFIFLEGYTKVGDNSAVNLLPVLAGKSILPQTGGDGKEVLPPNKTVRLEEIEFLWDMMKGRRCVTMLNDDIGDVRRGLFHYPKEIFNGYKLPPTNFYFRPFHLYNTRHNVIPVGSGQCMRSGEVCAEVYLDIWENFMTKFKDLCHFSFNFLTGLTHNDPNFVEAIDERLVTSLQRLHDSGALNSTVLVVMGDHGNRISAIQRSYIGRIEERAPLVSIKLPDAYTSKYQVETRNLKINTKRLTSNFDLHQTLKDLARAEFRRNRSHNDQKGRGISLLDEVVNERRTCNDAGIPLNFCLCMEHRNVTRMDRNSVEFRNLTQLLTQTISNNDCFDVKQLKVLSKKVDVYAINQMVRHGLRNVLDWPKVQGTQAMLEILYLEINITVPVITQKSTYQRTQILFRVKHYVMEGEYKIVAEPYVYYNELGCNVKQLSTFCFHCT